MAAFATAAAFALPAHAQDDPFQYLEDAADPRTQAFFAEQGARARAQLDAIPGRAQLLERIRALSGSAAAVSALALTAKRVFYLKREPRRGNVLYVREGIDRPERELLDPARLEGALPRAALDWFVPSPDGRHVAYGVSPGGNGDSVLRVLDADTGRDLGVQIDRARYNRELAWHPDGRSFYYARVPAANPPGKREANLRIYRHALGRDAQRDEIVFAAGVGGARDVPEMVVAFLHLPLESRYAYAIVREGVRREVAVHVAEQRELAVGRPRWRKLAGVEDQVLAVEGWRDELYVLSKRGAPRHRVLRAHATAHDLSGARVVVPEGELVLRSMALARDALYLRTMLGGVDRLERVPLGLLGAKAPEFVRIPFDNGITQLAADPRVNGALLLLEGWIESPTVVQVEARSGNVRNTRIQPAAQVDFSAMDEVRLYANGADGTRIPVTLLYRKSTRLTGDNPTLLVAYGAFGEPLSPRFDPARLAWLERGGVYAIAHVRGGGEYGEAWHQAGRHATKANTILDFLSVAQFLVSYGFASPQRLAVEGVEAGAIAAAGAAARRPELFAAVVARAPLADMLGYERMADGLRLVPEFGSASSAEAATQLRAMSAYHQVRDATAYPAILLDVSGGAARVEPWQAAKMAARLQAATSSGRPVLLRNERRASPEEDLADTYSFLLRHLGDAQFQLPAEPPPADAPPEAAPPTPEPKSAL